MTKKVKTVTLAHFIERMVAVIVVIVLLIVVAQLLKPKDKLAQSFNEQGFNYSIVGDYNTDKPYFDVNTCTAKTDSEGRGEAEEKYRTLKGTGEFYKLDENGEQKLFYGDYYRFFRKEGAIGAYEALCKYYENTVVTVTVAQKGNYVFLFLGELNEDMEAVFEDLSGELQYITIES